MVLKGISGEPIFVDIDFRLSDPWPLLQNGRLQDVTVTLLASENLRRVLWMHYPNTLV